jgi:hypothetical protein
MIEFLSDSIKLIFGIVDDQPLRAIHVAIATVLFAGVVAVFYYFVL